MPRLKSQNLTALPSNNSNLFIKHILTTYPNKLTRAYLILLPSSSVLVDDRGSIIVHTTIASDIDDLH